MWKYIYIRNICLKFLEVEAQRETSLPNPATVGCLFVLHLLVNSVIVMASQKGSRVQFCCYLRKQGWLFNLGALEWIHLLVCLNGSFDFCTPWNCQKIIDFLLVLGERRINWFAWTNLILGVTCGNGLSDLLFFILFTLLLFISQKNFNFV